MPDSGGEDSDVEMGDSNLEGPLENYLTEVVAMSQGLLNTRDRDGIGAEEILKIAEVATKAAGVAVLQERATAAANNACLLSSIYSKLRGNRRHAPQRRAIRPAR